ncbi:MAG TPA: M23 family metallopeptidase [Nitrospira sp.]|nr:M23 family metallopeptidase [Nitrospira sp.]HMU28541.1 M23 family metallopeptidase [Nitrospira sp.]HMV58037.1 M23 family metallopeptidase [Nitrospira sp.]HMW86810.1 M23 family metallopeptidase [Nitrospira sp.]HMX90086.1 M23 family metallopeptidase [Nitrospira sp.]
MSQQTAETSDAYTVVVFRGSSSKPLRFSFPRKFVRKLLILAAILIVADLLVVSHYVIRTGEVWQLSAFRAEAMGAREQTAAFSAAIDDLKKRLSAMGEVNQRLRVMLGIDTTKPAGDLANGRGGEDGPLPDGKSSVPGNGPASSGLESRQQVSELRENNQSDLDFSTESIEEATQQVRESLEALVREATQQEEALQSLTQVAEQRSTQWASTPSIWPVRGWVTSGFGPRVSPFTEKPAWHDGLDIGAQANSPVQAPALGRVVTVAFDSKMGNMVKLDHGYGIETVYGHLAKSLVKEGQRVKRGDVVALVGSTGLSTGPHLHYMVKKNGQALDPTKFILD